MVIGFARKIGTILLGIWVALQGLIPLFKISFSNLDTVMMILAIVAGVLTLLDI
jgi:hypothetical protein